MSKGFASYKIGNQNALHYLTFATVNWIDVFTGKKYRDVLIDSLAYCRKEKGLELYGYVIMSNHVHLIHAPLHLQCGGIKAKNRS